MRTLLASLFLSTALLAGCAAEPDPIHGNEGLDASAPAPQDGAAGAEASGRTSVAADEAGLPAAVCSAMMNLGTGVPGSPQLSYLGCAFEKAAPGDLSSLGGALVEVVWPDPLPTITAFHFFLLSDSCTFDGGVDPCFHDHVSSATPSVRYEVPVDLLRDFGDDGLRAYASIDGVAVQQEITIAVTLVPAGQQLPAGYTGLP